MENEKKTILYMITQSELGGAQTYVFDLAKYLKNDYRVVICYGEQGEKGELAEIAREMDIEHYEIESLVREINYAKDWKAFWYMVKLIKAIKPDIMHLNSSKISILGSFAGKFCGVQNIIYTAHGWVFNEKIEQKKKDLYIKLERFSAKFKHKIICVSHFDYKAALKYKICAKNKLTVVHNGIKQPLYIEKQEAKKLLGEKIGLNLNQDKSIIIGSIGNLYKNKGFGFLINATKILLDNGIDVKTIIIGEGAERKELLNWITQLHLERNVFLAGRINGGNQLLKAYDIYTCSSTKEGLSYTIIEAMMAELPIVATSVGGNPELISHQKTGLIVKPEKAKELASGIITLLNSPDIAKNYAEKAKDTALKKFSIERMLRETNNIYKK